MKSKKKIVNRIFNRIFLVGILLVIQVIWFIIFLLDLTSQSWWINILFTFISILAILIVINKEDNPAYKLAWVIPILCFPLFGGLLYVFCGNKKPTRKLRRKIEQVDTLLEEYRKQDKTILKEIGAFDKGVLGQVKYLSNIVKFPIYKNTRTQYFESGEKNFPVMLQELKKAKHFIFMEYFIIHDGRMWGDILEILKQKAKQGVEVRLLYDDFGSLTTLPYQYYKELEECGIHCEAFNPVVPILSIVMNNRDHRKILVIDGHTGFTGGINLSDEYINEKERFGYWKDTGIMLKGEAVWNLTLMFLEIWNALRPTDQNFEEFLPHHYHPEPFEGDGYVQPYGDSPLDEETVGENVYLNIINAAQEYLYAFTPYLIIDNEMITALCLAAKRGVDVRIVTPQIPDKKTVFCLTQSYYRQLSEAGVKIYQFTPGFIHAKCMVCDDKVATVGTINLDYRSLYLHFECGVFLYQTKSVLAVKEDAKKTIEKSTFITPELMKQGFFKNLWQAILRLFAPLM